MVRTKGTWSGQDFTGKFDYTSDVTGWTLEGVVKAHVDSGGSSMISLTAEWVEKAAGRDYRIVLVGLQGLPVRMRCPFRGSNHLAGGLRQAYQALPGAGEEQGRHVYEFYERTRM